MKKIINPKSASVWISRFVAAALISALSLAPGCVRDEGNVETGKKTAKVIITVNLPEPNLPTRSVEHENNIDNLDILVFEDNEGAYEFSYKVTATKLTPLSNQRFQAEVELTDEPIKLLVIANANGLTSDYTPSSGDSEATVKQALVYSTPVDGFATYLPMYGEYELSEGLTEDTGTIAINALRAVARVDVVTDLVATSNSFVLEEVYAYRVNNKFHLIPAPDVNPDAPIVEVPTVPADADMLADPIYLKVAEGTSAIEGLYIPESNTVGQSDDRLTGSTIIVIGGRHNGSETVTYYRANFTPPTDPPTENFGQVLRNHRYIFNITSVTATGWDTAYNAAINFNSPIQLNIQVWNDFESDISYGIDGFSISARSLNMRYTANRTKSVDIEATRSFTIQWLDADGNPTGNAVSSTTTESISNDNFEVAIVEGPGADEYSLDFRTLRSNHNGTSRITAKLRITFGITLIDVTVNQDYSGLYSQRSINVLSGYDYDYALATLGTTLDDDYAPYAIWGSYPGVAMRRILDANFAPNGTIAIGGFAFDLVSDDDDYLGTTNMADLAIMQRLIRMQDVIFLTYQTASSMQVSNAILNWLDESPHRVLIIACDNNASNTNLRNADGTWLFNITTGNYTAATLSGDNADFIDGPFGNVSNAAIVRRDDILGNCRNYTNVTPLLMHQTTTDAMIIGVNKTRKIIYIGDVDLFMHYTTPASGISNTAGNVVSNLDILMANTWAWVVEQVIYGDD